MGTLVISPVYEYGNFKSSSSSTHKAQSLQGRKSPVNNNNARRNSTSSQHNPKAVSPPHNTMRQSDTLHSPSSPKNTVESRNKLERAMSEPADRRTQQSSNSSRYKTELCRPFEENGTCKYGDKCQFAHGIKELRTLARHPKYKTELCRSFHTTGLCPYGPRCHFIHNSEPAKVGLFAPFSAGVGGPTLPPARPKALSSSSLGSAGDMSPPSSLSGSPTVMKTSENLFQFPSPSSNSAFSFGPHEFSSLSSLQRGGGGFLDYTTQEFNPEFYDTPNIFQERMLSSVFGSSDSGLDLDASSVCGSPTLELFPPPTPLSPTSPLDVPFVPFPVFNLFGKQELN